MPMTATLATESMREKRGRQTRSQMPRTAFAHKKASQPECSRIAAQPDRYLSTCDEGSESIELQFLAGEGSVACSNLTNNNT